MTIPFNGISINRINYDIYTVVDIIIAIFFKNIISSTCESKLLEIYPCA